MSEHHCPECYSKKIIILLDGNTNEILCLQLVDEAHGFFEMFDYSEAKLEQLKLQYPDYHVVEEVFIDNVEI
ncbi:hypothetical protein OAH07_03515 [Verrucomicrobia bacterium]|nr:hypothetical protein [bacterium]MDB4744936.1 hypothetical protein [Verrucomicrobiota bacterium]MDB4795681.1 hypothetical protein [Verrucomicrobiota bacterium]MDC0318019.1 hypothetical protein [bacterium]